MKKIFLFSFVLGLSLSSFSQKISNIRILLDTSNKKVKILYDAQKLTNSDSVGVMIRSSFTGKPTLTGAVGLGVANGKKKVIYWDVVKDNFNAKEYISADITVYSMPLPPPPPPSYRWIGASVGIGATLGAFLINKNYLDQRAITDGLALQGDPDNNGKFSDSKLYDQWSESYQKTKAAAGKKTIGYSLMGAAVLGIAFEVFTQLKHVKSINKQASLNIRPSTYSTGLSLIYRFN
ncbi:hypothetical protein [Runella sp.]|uniref:hypothetical protein n=1 Tax=Runella sp. TaxID=1960881 RepID=UPI0030166D96